MSEDPRQPRAEVTIPCAAGGVRVIVTPDDVILEQRQSTIDLPLAVFEAIFALDLGGLVGRLRTGRELLNS